MTIALKSIVVAAALCPPVWASPAACGTGSHKLTIANQSADTVHVTFVGGCFTGKFQDVNTQNDGVKTCWADLAPGGLTLSPAKKGRKILSKTFTAPPCWSGSIMVKCASCTTGIVSQVEFTLDGGLTVDDKTKALVKLPGFDDTYDLSLVNGFTKMLEVLPDQPSTGGATCVKAGCSQSPVCPATLKDGDACLSPIQLATRLPSKLPAAEQGDPKTVLKYGCTCAGGASCNTNGGTTVPDAAVGGFCCSPISEPGKSHMDSACCPFPAAAGAVCAATSPDRAWSQFGLDYINAVHQACPQGYAWQFDDVNHLFKCSNPGTSTPPRRGRNYTIVIN
jgi:hypothetical protein